MPSTGRRSARAHSRSWNSRASRSGTAITLGWGLATPGWPPARAYAQRIQQIVTDIVREGRESGEFERKTPLDETARAIFLVVQPYGNPLLLQYNLGQVEDAPAQLSSPVLRSLAP